MRAQLDFTLSTLGRYKVIFSNPSTQIFNPQDIQNLRMRVLKNPLMMMKLMLLHHELKEILVAWCLIYFQPILFQWFQKQHTDLKHTYKWNKT